MCLFGLFQERLNNEQMSCAGIEDKMLVCQVRPRTFCFSWDSSFKNDLSANHRMKLNHDNHVEFEFNLVLK